jgi:hypothetical protein
VHMRCMLWPPGYSDDGRTFDTFAVANLDAGCAALPPGSWVGDDPAAWREIVTRDVVAQAVRMRQALCYAVADAASAGADGDDGGVGDACISSDGCLPPPLLVSSLRRSCASRACMPGAAAARHFSVATPSHYLSVAGLSVAQQGSSAAA